MFFFSLHFQLIHSAHGEKNENWIFAFLFRGEMKKWLKRGLIIGLI